MIFFVKGNVYLIGGCYVDFVIGLLVVIEIGFMMFDFNIGYLVFIVGVIIDLRLGNVIFLGGFFGDLERGDEILVLFGDFFIEFFFGRFFKVISVRFVDDGEDRDLDFMGGGY